MAWSTPQTWVDGTVVNAAALNTQVRDNLTALQRVVVPTGTAIVGAASTSTTLMTLQGFQATPTTGAGGTVVVNFPAAFGNGVQTVQVTLGQSSNYVVTASSISLSGFTLSVFNPSSGAGVASTAVTIEVIAVGW